MRIIHVVYSCIPGAFRGGVSRVAYELASAAARAGHEVTVLASNYNSSVATDISDGDRMTTKDGVEIRYHDIQDRRTFRSPSLRKSLASLSPQADVIHAHNTFLALNRYSDDEARRSRVPVFYHPHGALDPIVVNNGTFRSLKKRAYIHAFEAPLLNRADGVVALTAMERDQIQAWGIATPIHVIPNGVRVNLGTDADGQQARDRFGIPKGAPVILFLGRLVRKKGVHVLAEAFARMQNRGAHLVIAGDPSQDVAYTREVTRILVEGETSDRAHWIGFVGEAEKPSVMAMASVYSHVSESEGMAMAVLEAMSSGIPTLVSQECYMENAVQAGAVVEVAYDARVLALKLDALLDDQEDLARVGDAGRVYAQAHHDWDEIGGKMIEAYKASIARQISS